MCVPCACSTSLTSSVGALPANQRSPSPSTAVQQASVEPVPAELQQLADQWQLVSVRHHAGLPSLDK